MIIPLLPPKTLTVAQISIFETPSLWDHSLGVYYSFFDLNPRKGLGDSLYDPYLAL